MLWNVGRKRRKLEKSFSAVQVIARVRVRVGVRVRMSE